MEQDGCLNAFGSHDGGAAADAALGAGVGEAGHRVLSDGVDAQLREHRHDAVVGPAHRRGGIDLWFRQGSDVDAALSELANELEQVPLPRYPVESVDQKCDIQCCEQAGRLTLRFTGSRPGRATPGGIGRYFLHQKTTLWLWPRSTLGSGGTGDNSTRG
jgi:hypothetical protein